MSEYELTVQHKFKTFGQMLTFLRGQNGLTQEQLANKLKTKQASIARWENSKNAPPLATQFKIGEVFGFACKKCKKAIEECKCKNKTS